MTDTSYVLKSLDTLMHERVHSVTLLRDHQPAPFGKDVDVLVASGDYLEVLATALDQYVSMHVTPGTPVPEIENVINALLYLQGSYKLVNK